MSLEIAVELRDAGFPQGGKVRPTEPAGWGGADDDTINPTLSELIDACGNRFGGILTIEEHPMGKWGAMNSVARSRMCHDLKYTFDRGVYIGKTPEEAVANLWLALNKK